MTDHHAAPGLASYLHGKQIAIIGGGPAGLTLACLLQRRGASVRVYERDVSSSARTQGGSLDLHQGSGQLALREAGLERVFRGVARPEGQRTTVLDRHGRLWLDMQAGDEAEARPEIDRGVLRDLLLDALEPGTVAWGHRLAQAIPLGGGRHRLDFAEQPSVVADLVIGCDGSGSQVRPLISPLRSSYTGVCFVETRIVDAERRHPALAQRVGPGSMMTLGDAKALMAQRNGNGDIRVYAVLQEQEDWAQAAGLDFARPQQVRAHLLALFHGWAPQAVELLHAAEDCFVPRPLHAFPADQAWPVVSGLTLLGDAAHVMPPFTGQGANLAMLDAVELARSLAPGRHASLDEAIGSFQRAMLARMKPAIEATLAAQALIIAADAPSALVAAMAAGSRTGTERGGTTAQA